MMDRQNTIVVTLGIVVILFVLIFFFWRGAVRTHEADTRYRIAKITACRSAPDVERCVLAVSR